MVVGGGARWRCCRPPTLMKRGAGPAIARWKRTTRSWTEGRRQTPRGCAGCRVCAGDRSVGSERRRRRAACERASAPAPRPRPCTHAPSPSLPEPFTHRKACGWSLWGGRSWRRAWQRAGPRRLGGWGATPRSSERTSCTDGTSSARATRRVGGWAGGGASLRWP